MRRDGTPGGQAVTERFRTDWATVLASSFGAVVVRCDGRGSGFQGTNLLHRIQKRLGVLEEQDQRDALGCVSQSKKRRNSDQTKVVFVGPKHLGQSIQVLTMD